MPKLVIGNFGGVVPRTTARMLRDNEAQLAENTRLYRGELQSWGGPEFILTPEIPGVRTIYRFRNELENDSIWLYWATQVNVARSPSADIDELRLYYTGDGKPKKTNWEMAKAGAWLYMGVPAPTTAPTVTVEPYGSAATDDSRYYVYTYVSEFGNLEEESAPSPPSELVTITSGESVTISGFAVPPTDGYNITKIRIYRTLAGQETAGVYAFVTEISVNSLPASYNDDLGPDELGEALTTIGWNPPPDNLQGIVEMPNGMLAGFEGNTVYFCEPYFPHAWPIRYAQSVPDLIVGLGVFGNTLAVLTQGTPYLMTGISPDTVTVERLSIPEPCVSAASIASDQYGVIYASPNGLVTIGPGTAEVFTEPLFRRDEWQDFEPGTLKGAIYDGKYFGAFQSSVHGNKTLVLSRDDHPALSYLDINALAIHTDIVSSELFYYDSREAAIYKFNAVPYRPIIYEWKSKRFQLPRAISWSALKLNLDQQQQDENILYLELIEKLTEENNILFQDEIGGEINGDPLNHFAVNGDILHNLPTKADVLFATVLLYGERGRLETTLSISSTDPVRIPPFKARELEVRITGTLSVQSIVLGTTVGELIEP